MGESKNKVDSNPVSDLKPQIIPAQTPKNPESKMKLSGKRIFLLVVAVLLLLAGGVGIYFLIKSGKIEEPIIPGVTPTTPITEETRVDKFVSKEDFVEYLEKSETTSAGFFGGITGMGIGDAVSLEAPRGLGQPSLMEGAPAAPSVDRVSETTVQVKGIDEPDIVKTDGASVFFSSTSRGVRPLPEPIILEEQIVPAPTYAGPETKIIKAFPPADLAKSAAIQKTGDLLLSDNVLVIFSGNDILGYDVSDPSAPSEKWKFELDSKNRIVSSRLFREKIFVVVQTRIDTQKPCPIPIREGDAAFSIACTDIYHPRTFIPTDTTFTAFSIEAKTGNTVDKVSFVGSSGSSVVYMSENGIYITYTYYESIIDFFFNFFSEKGQDLITQPYLDRLDKLRNYEISEMTKMMEFQVILEEYQSSLSDDERLRVQNEMTNRMNDYAKEHSRELEKTGIVKIDVDDLGVSATGGVPGKPLNQFSLDEYEDHLRIATTVGGNIFGAGESANDVYVLDKNLSVVGQVTDLGLTERIYSVRFIEDKGYVVTFRQIDPFYVLDLSSPKNPQLKGELKIPGYSSYLHPITKDKILGIGKEGSKVKASLFDVSVPETPSEAAKYLLDEYWSDILNTHHAFLLDAKHSVFFLPGNKGGYVFSYQNDQLNLVKAVSGIRARRAIYINDYMYIIGDSKLVILNEADWTEVNSLDF